MKKVLKKLVCIAAAIGMIVGLAPQKAQAETTKYSYQIVTLAQNTFVTAKGVTSSYNEKTDVDTETCTLYKLTVPASGYVKIQSKDRSYVFTIYKTFNKNADIYSATPYVELTNQKLYYMVLPAGTYYVQGNGGRFRWSFYGCTNTPNYCKAGATALASGKKFMQVMNPGYEYDRWYRITVPVKQNVKFTVKSLDHGDVNILLYNANGVGVKLKTVTAYTTRTASNIAAGTYFLRVQRDSEDETLEDYYAGRISTILWK